MLYAQTMTMTVPLSSAGDWSKCEVLQSFRQPVGGTAQVSQYCILLRKNIIAYWRYPSYNAVRWALPLCNCLPCQGPPSFGSTK